MRSRLRKCERRESKSVGVAVAWLSISPRLGGTCNFATLLGPFGPTNYLIRTKREPQDKSGDYVDSLRFVNK